MKKSSNLYLVSPMVLTKKVIGQANIMLISEEDFKRNISLILLEYKKVKDLIFLSTVNPLVSKIPYIIRSENAGIAKREQLAKLGKHYSFVDHNKIDIYDHNYTEIY